jgi:hypothetical protein
MPHRGIPWSTPGLKERAMRLLRESCDGLRERTVRLLRESRDWRRTTGEQFRRVCPWLFLILVLNVFGWLLASFLVKS